VEAIGADPGPRAAFIDLLAQATLAADLAPLTPGKPVPQAWMQWLARFDEALERAQQSATEHIPAVAPIIQRLRDDLDRAVAFEPGSPLVVDSDEVEAVAVLSLRLASSLLDEHLATPRAATG